ncbi:MAG: hypothetical protein AAGL24_25350 [Pseudomonadota bacterium]
MPKGLVIAKTSEKIAVENINTPGRTSRVDRAKYEAMRDALVAALPKGAPGLTAAEAKTAVLPVLPETHFPGGATAGWWLKTVQLDLEAKGIVQRENTKPLRFHRA